jgi:hypothetical protein
MNLTISLSTFDFASLAYLFLDQMIVGVCLFYRIYAGTNVSKTCGIFKHPRQRNK